MNVLITGGAGFIGSNLVRHLVTSGHRVTVMDDFSTGRRSNLEDCEVSLLEGSILDVKLLAEAVNDMDTIVHLAARPSVPRSITDPRASHDVNVTGTLNVLEAARRTNGNAHIILASSSSVYGSNAHMPKSEDLVPMPVSPYAASKLAAESYALAYAKSYGLNILVFRFFNVYGPFQHADHAYAAVVPAFISSALRREPLIVHGDGEQTRDFTYVGSLVRIVREAIESVQCAASPVNLAFGSNCSLLHLSAEIERVIGRTLALSHTDSRPGDVRQSQADCSLLKSLFPDAEAIPLSEGLRATIAWFEENNL